LTGVVRVGVGIGIFRVWISMSIVVTCVYAAGFVVTAVAIIVIIVILLFLIVIYWDVGSSVC
jgi:hypothetical protein